MNRALARLDLDFRLARSAPWVGVLLLATALGFAADLGYSYLRVREASAQKEARLAQLSQGLSRSGDSAARRAARDASPEEVRAARESLRQLSIPWNRLFQALESAGGGQARRIVLLAIEPDPDAGSVGISGEGEDYLAVLNYVLELRRAGTLGEVALVHHEVSDAARAAERSRRVAFSISASWGEAKP